MEEEEEEKFMKSAKKNAGCTINARSTRDYEPMRVPTTRFMEERGGGGELDVNQRQNNQSKATTENEKSIAESKVVRRFVD